MQQSSLDKIFPSFFLEGGGRGCLYEVDHLYHMFCTNPYVDAHKGCTQKIQSGRLSGAAE